MIGVGQTGTRTNAALSPPGLLRDSSKTSHAAVASTEIVASTHLGVAHYERR